ncbi:MAG: drug efflux transport system ATP-binding protein [Bacteroidales bacterium]|jgi:ABC-2 type transport system ATP-binding protein|nr:drug efflux transport system ATP-binding protein [Bacteroidales bacterium]MDN5329945.1 drug efflux transport system ATP-binding protein [Bacteroidales bacterium]NLH51998.1 ABC transporter ATP-binding protein [Bacteroidales bacterium]NPV36910.1 ABC transporter ATP-binding protein [Bacteroidales bacterium]
MNYNTNNLSIKVENLERRFGNFTAVNKISFSVRRGEIFGLLGANGAGKTTTLRMLCGLLAPTSGTALIDNTDVARQPEKVRFKIGYMSQRFSLYEDLTVWENFRFYGGVYGMSAKDIRKKFEDLSQRLNFGEQADRLTRDLPLGWKQKLAFMVAAFHNPPVIFLDEPTSGVDPMVRRQFWDLIYESALAGTTIIVTTHYLDEAMYCDRLAIMAEGSIKAYGTPAGVLDEFKAVNMQEVFLKIAGKEALLQ